MPLYVYCCPHGHSTELIRPWDTVSVLCACGQSAERQSVNRVAATGLAPVPSIEKNYRREFADYREASQEVDYHYTRAETNGDPVKAPDLFTAGVQRAKELTA